MKIYTIYLLLLLLLSSKIVFSQNSTEDYNLSHPQLVQTNSSFEVSLVTSNYFEEADRLEIFYLNVEKLNLIDVELRTSSLTQKLSMLPVYVEELNKRGIKIIVDLKENNLKAGNFFQLLFQFKADNIFSAELNFYGVFKENDEALGFLKSGDEASGRIISSNVKFYKPSRVPGKALQIDKNAFFTTSLKEKIEDNIAFSFWGKFKSLPVSFLTIASPSNNNFEIELLKNENGMLQVNSTNEILSSKPLFISSGNWYYFTFVYLKERSSIIFLCNDDILFEIENLTSQINDLELQFKNNGNQKYSIDLLNFYKIKENYLPILRSKHYLLFEHEEIKLTGKFNFDSQEMRSNGRFNISSASLQYVRSDAPIFTRSAELNIKIMANAYELEWSGGDYSQAASYTLEKSIDREFYPVFTIQADNSNERIYSFIDTKDYSSEIIYYRVKQANRDGSIVYSAQVKVGQKNIESFSLQQNFPNPFNPSTTIAVELLEDIELDITVYNLEGREMIKLYKGFLAKGIHQFSFDGAEFPSGIYLYQVTAPGISVTRKMILAK
jgi:hypothetical protein